MSTVQVLTPHDLAALDAFAVTRRNRDLQAMARRIYGLGGQRLRFAVSEQAPPQGGLQAQISWQGHSLWVALDRAWSAALLSRWPGQQLAAPQVLELMALTRVAPALPQGVGLERLWQAAPGEAAPPAPLAGVWTGQLADTGEPSGHALALWAAPELPVYAFFQAFDAWLVELAPTPLAGLPIDLPLVAARWQAPAADLQDLAAGDVLMIQ